MSQVFSAIYGHSLPNSDTSVYYTISNSIWGHQDNVMMNTMQEEHIVIFETFQ